MIEEEADGVSGGEIEAEVYAGLGDDGVYGCSWISLEQDRGGAFLVLERQRSAEDSRDFEGIVSGTFAPFLEELLELERGLVVEKQVGAEAFDPSAGDGAEAMGVRVTGLELVNNFRRDPRLRGRGRHDGKTVGRGRRIAGWVQFN